MFSRRQFLEFGATSALSLAGANLLPAWARSSSQGNKGISTLNGTSFDLHVSEFPVQINGQTGKAIGINHTLPAPLIRFREGQDITLNVHNMLKVDTSIHWHGLLVPFEMDGVPGVTFPGIRPGETFRYKFSVPQNGTYWYHSHSGLQEQVGMYGPLIIDPAHHDPVQADREYVMVLSDWSFESPERIFSKLKKVSHTYNFSERTLPDFLEDANEHGLSKTLSDRAMWGHMRMSPRDISDVTGSTYHFLINGHTTLDNWNGVFKTGERVRLRIINASAMTIFNVRMPGLPMTIVQADGLHVKPLETDEFQIGVAETYDVIIEPDDTIAYAFVAEAIDRSGQVVATFGPKPGMRAEAPPLRAVPTLTMRDMGMDHGAHTGHSNPQPDKADDDPHAHHGHTMPEVKPASWPIERPELKIGPGVTSLNAMPLARLDEPGLGLEHVPHRVLTYSQLRSLEPNPDARTPSREIEIHLTANMERYMWSFDGVRFADIRKPIQLRQGERVRFTLVNNTMMNHPIHLHGMFFDLDNGGGRYRPRKHTVTVKPAEKLSFDVTADHVGDWAFHCHLLYHMHAGMMQVVSVLPDPDLKAMKTQHPHDHHKTHSAPKTPEKPPAKPGGHDHSHHHGHGAHGETK